MSNSINGIDNLMKKLNELGVNAEEVVKKSMRKNIQLVKDEAKLLCPARDGDLRKSIRSSVSIKKGTIKGMVYTNSDHAAYVEFGTGIRGQSSNSNTEVNVRYKQDWSGMEAQPYLYPALKNNKDKVLNEIEKDVKKAIREVARR
ncbi:HK97-gp10 family putative phage morphogenesis protein [Clostridium sp.]|uniref:HK97-gp10 family putative phage morphogenesis protein n=1 Tax=Clostridium sp. TaxID=1506 RepID=UPI002631E922|nr:HK97-gp10 family putative phage morphogenesis protein [Clostridium sp.]